MYEAVKIAQRINALAKMNWKSINEVLIGSGVNTNLYTSMVSRGSIPRADNLAKIADYFGVSLDYILGRTPTPLEQFKKDLNEKTAEFLTFETVTAIYEPELYQIILNYRMMSEKNKKTFRNNQIKLLEAQKLEFESNGYIENGEL